MVLAVVEAMDTVLVFREWPPRTGDALDSLTSPSARLFLEGPVASGSSILSRAAAS